MSLLTDVKALMTGVSSVYLGSMPDKSDHTVDNAVAIYNTGGYARSLSGTYVEEPTFMIKVRNTSYATGETLCNTIKVLLHGKTSTKLLMIEQQGDINDLGVDSTKLRHEWTLNFRCYYRR